MRCKKIFKAEVYILKSFIFVLFRTIDECVTFRKVRTTSPYLFYYTVLIRVKGMPLGRQIKIHGQVSARLYAA